MKTLTHAICYFWSIRLFQATTLWLPSKQQVIIRALTLLIDHALIREHGRRHDFELLRVLTIVWSIDIMGWILLNNIHTTRPLRQVARSCKAGRRQWPVISSGLHAAGWAAANFRMKLHHCLSNHGMLLPSHRAASNIKTILFTDGHVAATSHRHLHSLVPILLIEVMLICIKHFKFKIWIIIKNLWTSKIIYNIESLLRFQD